MKSPQNKSEFFGALVWLLSGGALLVYGILGFLEWRIPGVEQLVQFLRNVEGWHLYLAAFLSIFIEGLYFVGSIFPGSTLIVLLAILSQIGGMGQFAGVIFMVFVGWIVAGIVNIWLATRYRNFFLKHLNEQEHDTKEEDKKVYDNITTTWFPAFRANYEVSQIVEGAKVRDVFLSSLRVKFFVSLAGAVYTLILPFIIDISELSNKEGFATLAIVATITIGIGIGKILKSYGKIDFDY